jgi:hypothetical protein
VDETALPAKRPPNAAKPAALRSTIESPQRAPLPCSDLSRHRARISSEENRREAENKAVATVQLEASTYSTRASKKKKIVEIGNIISPNPRLKIKLKL